MMSSDNRSSSTEATSTYSTTTNLSDNAAVNLSGLASKAAIDATTIVYKATEKIKNAAKKEIRYW